MKPNCQLIDFKIFPISAIVLAILLTGAFTSAKAQFISQTVINGLFTPTEAQRFFQEGRRKFESDARILSNSDYYFNSNILQISPELLESPKNYKYHNFLREDALDGCCQLFKTPSSDR